MSVQRAVDPDVRPVDRGIYQISERRERAPKQPFPELPERDGRKREREHGSDADRPTPENGHRIDIRV